MRLWSISACVFLLFLTSVSFGFANIKTESHKAFLASNYSIGIGKTPNMRFANVSTVQFDPGECECRNPAFGKVWVTNGNYCDPAPTSAGCGSKACPRQRQDPRAKLVCVQGVAQSLISSPCI